ncbi:MAG: hypothetical protein E6Q97_36875 [Desulfurellales bacterium]|nr:MAG: hypothetical protein E6Q97_36875 [Desulfurellales bacterium]
MFTLSVWDRDNNAVIVPAGLVFTVTRIGAVAQGGYDSAEIAVAGPELALHPLRSWLRYRVEIWGDAGMVWEGHVDEIMLTLQGVTVTTGTEQIYNAIKVIYSYTGDDGGSETGETDWGTDTDSINEYGRKEAIHSSGGETTAEAATALRDTVLAGTKKANAPTISIEAGGEESGAILTCSGRYHQLEWRYHTDTGGYEANEQTGERALLGWTYTATSIGFVTSPYNRLVDYNSHLDALEADDPLLVSGTWGGSNNGVYVVKTKIGGDPETYTASTISFDPADDVLDSAGGLGFVRAKEGVVITGTTGALNDGVYLSSDVTSATRFEVASYGASPVVAQAAGPSVTIATAHAVELTTSPINETSGNSITITAYGQKMAQRFQLSNGPWTCGEIAIHVAKWGTPSDDVVISLFSDNGSDQPNALLGYGLIHPADVPSQSAAWRSAKLITPVTLANATKYHIVVSRGGSSHHLNYYTVSRDSDGQYSDGALLLWTGSAWAAPYTTTDMAFKLWATLDSTAKIAGIVAGATGVVSGTYSQNLSSVRTRQLRDNRSTAWEEIIQLLNTGNSAGARLLCSVTPQGTLIIDAEPAYDAQTALVWTRDGRLRYANGRYLLPGVLPVGKWVQVETLLSADWQADTTRFIVDSAEYDAQSGRWSLRPKAAANPFDLGTEQG